MTNQYSIETKRKTGKEIFQFRGEKLDISLLDFWSWNTSDLLNNAMRGKLAEYIIAHALNVDGLFRIEWDTYDLIYKGLKIEVKSGAYLQSWEQEKYSNIVLNIKPTIDYFGKECKRQSDIYIFAILGHKESKTANPLNLEQWEFYIVETLELDKKLPNQKTIGLTSLQNIEHVKCTYDKLREAVDALV